MLNIQVLQMHYCEWNFIFWVWIPSEFITVVDYKYVQSSYSCSQNVFLGLAAVRETEPALISAKQA